MMQHTSSVATPLPYPAYILAGGQSRRFGRDKARVVVGEDRPLIVRLIEQLQACGHSVEVVADARERYADLEIVCLVDAILDSGPLGGLVAALEHRRDHYGQGWLWVLNCDLVTWQASWSKQMLEKVSEIESARGQHVEAAHCVHASSDGIAQPLPGLYHTRTIEVAREQLAGRRLALRALLERQHTVEVALIPSPLDYAFNTQAELVLAEERLSTCARISRHT